MGEVQPMPARSDNEEVAESRKPGESLLDNLRQKREKIGGPRRLKLDIPGYDGELVAEYKPVSWDEMKKMAEKLERSNHPQKELLSQCDLLIKGCVCIYLKRNDEAVPLNEVCRAEGITDMGDLDEPIRYDERLAKFLEFKTDTARQVVLGVFNNPLAVTAHHNLVGKWMQESQVEDDEDF